MCSSPRQKPATPSFGSTRTTRSGADDAVRERVDRVADADAAARARGRRRSPSRPAAASGPRSRSRARRRRSGAPRRSRSRAAARSARPGAASSVVATAALANVSGEHAVDVGSWKPASRDRSAAPSASPPTDTTSSIGPSCSYAPRRIDDVNVSPTTNDPVMIAVPSSDPRITSTVSRGRRATLRSASRRSTGRRIEHVEERQRTERDDDHAVDVVDGGAADELVAHDPAVAHADEPVRADCPTPSSCVTRMSVRPSALSSRSSSMTSTAVSESSAPVGSSAHTTRGRPASARATVTRCCSPPDSSPGRCRARSAEPDALERLVRAPARFLRVDAREQQRQLDVLDRAEHRDQVVRLEDETHRRRAAARALGVGQRVQVDAVEQHAAAVDVVEARAAVEQRRLARARRAHDRHELALVHDEVDVAQRLDLFRAGAVDLAHALGHQQLGRVTSLHRQQSPTGDRRRIAPTSACGRGAAPRAAPGGRAGAAPRPPRAHHSARLRLALERDAARRRGARTGSRTRSRSTSTRPSSRRRRRSITPSSPGYSARRYSGAYTGDARDLADRLGVGPGPEVFVEERRGRLATAGADREHQLTATGRAAPARRRARPPACR